MSEERPFEPVSDGPRVIVVGVDGSETSLRAGAYAWGLARRSGARLILVQVTPMTTISTLTAGGAAIMRETAEELAEELRAELRRVAEQMPGVRYEVVLEHGDAVTVLARIADEVKADAVVVGASAKAGHRFVGSVAIRLVRAGRWPVTVVP
ncbi:universal stress protein A [Actinomadura sp. NBRC 104412]|uniref:universal stress protein n=1 Tax=Actinomadura sp. NBRC 104412 TaxID=3032203 RepID=UPI0024A17ABC|nr:universal stress protein [Actinomadura sp. NBRC 104412]GLZ05883.1 universal stress protein A [Actinomadura sp. NBRC 104412]